MRAAITVTCMALLATAGLVSWGATPAESGGRSAERRCGVRGGSVLLQNPSLVVYSRPIGRRDRQYFFCLRSAPRNFQLGECTDETCIGNFRLAGATLAYVGGGSSRGEFSSAVSFFQLRRGFGRSEILGSANRVAALEASARGAAVWVEMSPERSCVRLISRTVDGALLDCGAIDSGSLAVSADGGTAYWRNAGALRSAPL